jgi:hypothetical protein
MSKSDKSIPETSAEKAQAEIATKRWADYQEIFKPYEDKFMGKVDSLNSEANLTRAENLSMSPLAKQFAQEGMQIRKKSKSRGVNPNSGKAMSMDSALSGAQASAEVDARSRGVASQQDNYVTGLQNVVAMGNGQAGQAMQGMTDIAKSAQRNAYTKAQSALSDRNNIRSGVGAAVGAGLSYGLNQKPADSGTGYSSWDDSTNQTYSANVDPFGRGA